MGGQYREIVPLERIVLTWVWQEKERSSSSIVTVRFFERGDATEVVLTHEGLETEQARDGHRYGWVGCFDKLAKVLYGGSSPRW